MTLLPNHANFLILVVIIALLALAWAVYSPALGGAFLFDDWHNLRG